MADIRLYIYSSGRLQALGNKAKGVHKFTSVSQCKRAIRILQTNPSRKRQFVMIEYTGTNQSEIIYVSHFDLAKTL
jgi:hypothetical protein